MLGWLREHVAPIASWTTAWTAVGAVLGGASAAISTLAGVSAVGPSVLGATLLLALWFGVAGFFCSLLYHGLALRGRPARYLSARATALYGALVGILPVVMGIINASRRGAQVFGGVSAAVTLTGLGAATALYLRWRDQRRVRMQQELADPTAQLVADVLRRETTERAAT